MAYRPYSIRVPPFDITSGGIRVVYGLFGWLLAKGQIVFLNTNLGKDSIAIYPEIYHGNDLGGSTVVRYILNKPGVMGMTMNGVFTPGPTTFDPTDKIYVFSKIFDTFYVDYDHILFLPILNLQVFKDQKKKRTKTCYLIGKGKNKCIHPKGAIEITREFAQDQQALADLLNECTVLYGYDKLSAMYEIARLCGCRVKYYGGYDEQELNLYEPGMNGFGVMGEDRTLYTEAFREHYVEMIRMFDKKLDTFISETQNV